MCFCKVPASGPLRSVRKALLFKKPEESGVCLTKMAQGLRPACRCLSEECLLSGGEGAGSGDSHRASGRLGAGACPCSAGFSSRLSECAPPTKSGGVRPEEHSSAPDTKLATSLRGCLLRDRRWMSGYFTEAARSLGTWIPLLRFFQPQFVSVLTSEAGGSSSRVRSVASIITSVN